MRYSAISPLLAMVIIAAACGSGPTLTEAGAETGDPLATNTPVNAATSVPSILISPSAPSAETPIPSPLKTPVAVETPQPVVITSLEPTGKGSQLKMVLIRASAPEVEQLRKMRLDIIRVTPVGGRQTLTTKTDFLQSKFVVEVVVSTGLLAKLQELGFDVTEVP